MRHIKHVVLSLFFALFFVWVTPVSAATIQFSPSSGSQAVGSTFAVQIKVNTGGVDTTSTDAVITYSDKLLSVDSVSYGSFYDTVLHNNTSGKLSISGMVSDAAKVVNGTGTLATVSFKALTSGTADLTFVCTSGQTDDSNVTKNDINSTDIIDCSSLTKATFNLGSSSSTTAPTSSGSSGSSSSSSGSSTAQIPQAGGLDMFSLIPKIGMALLLLVVGLVPLLI